MGTYFWLAANFWALHVSGAALAASVLTSIWVRLFRELKATGVLSQPFPYFSLQRLFFFF
jgi:hypothetical protein